MGTLRPKYLLYGYMEPLGSGGARGYVSLTVEMESQRLEQHVQS